MTEITSEQTISMCKELKVHHANKNSKHYLPECICGFTYRSSDFDDHSYDGQQEYKKAFKYHAEGKEVEDINFNSPEGVIQLTKLLLEYGKADDYFFWRGKKIMMDGFKKENTISYGKELTLEDITEGTLAHEFLEFLEGKNG